MSRREATTSTHHGTPKPPVGLAVELRASTRWLEGGRLLVGGSPLTAMRLSPPARELLAGRRLTVTDGASGVVADRLLATNLARLVLDSAAPAGTMDLTVVVPVRDRPEQLDRCLAGLRPLSVIVVDDASHDPLVVRAVAARHGATVVPLASNVGPAGARNAGLSRVRTPLVAFVDSDVETTAGALVELTRHLADPAVALVGPRVVGLARSRSPRWFERYDAAVSSLDLGPRPHTVRPGAGVAWLPSACLVGRTATLGAGFDPDLRVGEDVDLVWRLVEGGHRVRYEPAVTVLHDARPALGGWLGRKVLYGSGGALLAERHSRAVAPAVLSPALAVAGAALMVRSRWSPGIAGAAVAYAAGSVAGSLPREVSRPARVRLAGSLAVRGLGWAVRQEAALAVRHWWPAAALGCLLPAGRRALATAVVVDSVVTAAVHRDRDLDLPTLLAGRRLDDLAYGTGLWWGALRARSVAALLPRRPHGGGRAGQAGRAG